MSPYFMKKSLSPVRSTSPGAISSNSIRESKLRRREVAMQSQQDDVPKVDLAEAEEFEAKRNG